MRREREKEEAESKKRKRESVDRRKEKRGSERWREDEKCEQRDLRGDYDDAAGILESEGSTEQEEEILERRDENRLKREMVKWKYNFKLLFDCPKLR